MLDAGDLTSRTFVSSESTFLADLGITMPWFNTVKACYISFKICVVLFMHFMHVPRDSIGE
jgi:hypothetical protein